MDYEGTVQWLYDLSRKERSGMRLGLGSITGLCKRVGDPQDGFRSVHVAGTNGKGSVAHMVEAVLRSAGTRTGLYTSPHLQSFCERIRVDGAPMTEDEVVAIGQGLFPHVEAMGFDPTFFDVTTALAFMYFNDREVQRAVVEVGLGGRLDSTNVLRKVDVCVITSIGLEHTDVLGKDVASITKEKASIIKKGARVVTGRIPSQGWPVVTKMAEKVEAGISKAPEPVIVRAGPDGTEVEVEGIRDVYRFVLPLIGPVQASNAAVAITALECLDDPPSKHDIEDGLSKVEVHGRMELVHRGPDVYIDGAHNPDAAREVARTMEGMFPGQGFVLVVGMMVDKDAKGFLGHLGPLASAIVVTRTGSPRSMSPATLGRMADHVCPVVKEAEDIEDAIRTAMELAQDDGVVLVTGSFYLVGQVRQTFVPVRRYL